MSDNRQSYKRILHKALSESLTVGTTSGEHCCILAQVWPCSQGASFGQSMMGPAASECVESRTSLFGYVSMTLSFTGPGYSRPA